LVKYIKTRIDDHENEICCPYDSCNQIIDRDKMSQILSNESELFGRYIDISNNINVSLCPDCKRLCKKDGDCNKAYCRDCYRDFCHICGETHSEYDYCCNESDMRDSIAEIQSALDDCNVRVCPLCRILIEKIEGCSAMRCKYCKIKFCWECLITNHQIKKLDSHGCRSYDRYAQTGSDDEYHSGSDLSDVD
jgi:E3 ubiquitin-protein ligase RNF144